MKFGIGQAVRRTEDVRFVTGNGQYADDIKMPGMAWCLMVRSQVAHANITWVDWKGISAYYPLAPDGNPWRTYADVGAPGLDDLKIGVRNDADSNDNDQWAAVLFELFSVDDDPPGAAILQSPVLAHINPSIL